MQKKIIWVVIVVVVVVGGALVFAHKSPKKAATNSNTGSSYSSSSSYSGTSTGTNPAVNNSVLTTKTASSVGQYLADTSGKTLYTYADDAGGTSYCTGSCLASWPAYVDGGATTGLPTNVTVITRSDNGKQQYTYKGKPLYYFAGDTSAGQVTGNGVGGFSVAKP